MSNYSCNGLDVGMDELNVSEGFFLLSLWDEGIERMCERADRLLDVYNTSVVTRDFVGGRRRRRGREGSYRRRRSAKIGGFLVECITGVCVRPPCI